MEIRIDNREPQGVVDAFKELDEDFEIVQEKLDVGDIVCGEVAIERKTPADFVESIRNRRLQKQCIQMSENYEHAIVILEGSLNQVYKDPFIENWTTNHEAGSVGSIATKYGVVGPITAKNTKRLAKYSHKMIEKGNDEDGSSAKKTKLEIIKEKISGGDVKSMMIMCIPGIGPSKAQKLADDISFLIVDKDTGENIRKGDLKDYKGIGSKTAEKILAPFDNTEVNQNDF